MLPAHMDAAAVQQAHPKRQREWLASRILVYELLQQFTPQPLPLQRDQNGKPYFDAPDLHVSITHSPHLAAVVLSDRYEVGIDIELVSPKALRVADKFLTEEEKQYTGGDEQLTCLYWSAKETLYKMYSRRQLVFKENLFVSPAEAPNVLQGRVQMESFLKLYQIYHDTIENHVLTYSIDDTTNFHEES